MVNIYTLSVVDSNATSDHLQYHNCYMPLSTNSFWF